MWVLTRNKIFYSNDIQWYHNLQDYMESLKFPEFYINHYTTTSTDVKKVPSKSATENPGNFLILYFLI